MRRAHVGPQPTASCAAPERPLTGCGVGFWYWHEPFPTLQSLPYVVDPRELVEDGDDAAPVVAETGDAPPGDRPDEVVVAVGPAFGDGLRATINEYGFVLPVLDSFYNVAGGIDLKDRDAGKVVAAIKSEVCDPTGCTVLIVDHAPWPTDAKGWRSASG